MTRETCCDCGETMRPEVVSVHRALRHGTGGDADHLAPVRDAMAKGKPIRKPKVRFK